MTKPGCDVVRTWEKLLGTVGELYQEQSVNSAEYTKLLLKLWKQTKGAFHSTYFFFYSSETSTPLSTLNQPGLVLLVLPGCALS